MQGAYLQIVTSQANDPAPTAPTEYLVKMARGLSDALGNDVFSPATKAAREAASQIIDAAMYRDLDAAMREAGRLECEKTGEEYKYGGAAYSLQVVDFTDGSREAPKHYTEQCAYRDYSGYLCKSERMAKWVAAWITKYLDPRDSDNNPMPNRVHSVFVTVDGEKQERWLAVEYAVKVPD